MYVTPQTSLEVTLELGAGSSLAPCSSLKSHCRRLHSRFSASLGPASHASRRFFSRSAHSSTSWSVGSAATTPILYRCSSTNHAITNYGQLATPSSLSVLCNPKAIRSRRDVQATIRVGGEGRVARRVA